jgi:acylglycerol lipase
MIFETTKIHVDDNILLNAKIKENGKSKWLIAVHGLGEHKSYCDYLFDLLSREYNIITYDLRGHGESSGEIGCVSECERDLQKVLDYLTKHYSMSEYVLVGHSFGSLVCMQFLQNFSYSIYPSRVFLVSPLLRIGLLRADFMNVLLKPISLLEKLFPVGWPIDFFLIPKWYSHDKMLLEKYSRDVLVKKHIKLTTLLRIIRQLSKVLYRKIESRAPLYIIYAGDDHIVAPEIVENYFEEFERGAILKRIEGSYHYLHFEVNRYRKQFRDFLNLSLLELMEK